MPKKLVARYIKNNGEVIFNSKTNTGIFKGTNIEYLDNPIPYLDSIYKNFILPYLENPLAIDPLSQINQFIYIIQNILDTEIIENTHTLILVIFRDALKCLLKARTDHVNLLAHKNEILYVNKQFDNVNLLNIQILKELHLLSGSNGSVYVQMNSLKPSIYMQTIFDLVSSWYEYIYKNIYIDEKSYGFIKNYVTSIGTNKEASNLLINLLDSSKMYSTNYYNVNYNTETYHISNYNSKIIFNKKDLSSNIIE